MTWPARDGCRRALHPSARTRHACRPRRSSPASATASLGGPGTGSQPSEVCGTGEWGSRSSRTVASSTPARPSAMAWWSISNSATRPPWSPSINHMSHRGWLRSSGKDIRSAQKARSWASSPGSGSAAWCTWLAMSNSGSSTHTGAGSPSKGSRTRLRSLGTRCSRLSTSARTSRSRREPRPSCSGAPSKIPMDPMCMGVCGDSMYKNDASSEVRTLPAVMVTPRRARRADLGEPVLDAAGELRTVGHGRNVSGDGDAGPVRRRDQRHVEGGPGRR